MGLALPKDPLPAMQDIRDFPMLFYGGGSGVGCSCLVASLQTWLNANRPGEKAIYIDCDALQSLKAHTLHRVAPTNWQEFKDYVVLAVKDPAFQWIVVDHLHGAYRYCFDAECKRLGISHPGDRNDMGKTWSVFTNTFMGVVDYIARSGKGFLATSHAINSQIVERGRAYNLWIPSFVGGGAQSAYGRIIGLFPEIGFIHLEGIEAPPTKATDTKVVDIRSSQGTYREKRVIEFTKGVHWEAKDRSRRFTRPIVLPDDYRQDWTALSDMWEEGGEQ